MTDLDPQTIAQIFKEIINTLLSNLFSSISNNLYETLDNLAFVSTDILHDSIFTQLFGISPENGMLLIANSLLTGFVLYYLVQLLFSYFIFSEIQRPSQYIFRLLVFSILMNSSFFICEQFIQLNSHISLAIRELGESIYHKNICFSSLLQTLNDQISITENSVFNLFSINGVIKFFIYFSLINILFSYSLRYVMIKVFILISPFAFLSLINKNSVWFFQTWLKSFLALLFLQILIAIILLIIFSIDFSSNIFSKILYLGGLYAITKSNQFIKELMGGITTNVSQNLYQFKYMFRGLT